MAEMAKANLSNLPLGTINTVRSNQYLSQLGDFSYSLAQKAADGQEINDSDWQKIRQLHNENRTIHKELRSLVELMQEKQVRFGSLARVDKDKLPQESLAVLEGFGKLDERLQNEVPTLTYDGPFSDHVVNRSPRGLTGAVINKTQAENIALQFIKKMNRTGRYTVGTTSLASGRIASYSVTLKPQEAGRSELILGISRKGGHVVLMMDGGEPAAAKRMAMHRPFARRRILWTN
jgi:germination protein YpeB